jgi:hypothetical protein
MPGGVKAEKREAAEYNKGGGVLENVRRLPLREILQEAEQLETRYVQQNSQATLDRALFCQLQEGRFELSVVGGLHAPELRGGTLENQPPPVYNADPVAELLDNREAVC